MYKRKVEIPYNFMECLKYSMDGYTEEDLSLIEEDFVLRTMNRYSMECRNIIIEVLCDIYTVAELSFAHDIPEDCIRHYCNDLKWRVARKYNIKPKLYSFDKEVITKKQYDSLSFNNNLLQSELTRRSSVALSRCPFNTLGELLDYFETQPMRLFQDVLRACSADTISDLTEFCKRHSDIRKTLR